jgi:Papain family cysteine protease
MRSCKKGLNELPSPYRIFDCGNGTCDDGMSLLTLDRVMRVGVNDLMKSPAAYSLGCLKDGSSDLHYIQSYVVICSSYLIKRELLHFGPIIAVVPFSDYFSDYTSGSGVYVESDTANARIHAIAVIGWGNATEDEPEHWLVQNSWSREWGDGGRGKIYMDFFQCMIAQT